MRVFSRFRFSRKLLSDGIWSLAGNVVGVLTGLGTVGLITQLVDPEAYGQANLVLGVGTLVSGFLIGPLMVTHNRTYFDYMQRGMGSWFVKVFRWILIVPNVATFLLYLLAAGLFSLVSGETVYLAYAFPILLLIVAQTYLNALLNYVEAHRQQRKRAVINILQRALYPLFLLILLLTPLSQANVVVLSQALIPAALLLFFRTPVTQDTLAVAEGDQRKELVVLRRALLSSGWAVAMGYVLMWLLTTSDRYLISHFMTKQDVGIYSVNYGLWSLPFVTLNSWLEVFTRPIIYGKAAVGDWAAVRKTLLLRTALGFGLSVAGTVLLFFLNGPIGELLLGAEYRVGPELAVVLASAYCFLVLGYSVMPIFLAAKRLRLIPFACGTGALVNIGLNIAIIPLYGIQGAAITTLVALVIWALVMVVGAQLLLSELMKGPLSGSADSVEAVVDQSAYDFDPVAEKPGARE